VNRPIAILLGSDSDFPFFRNGVKLLKKMGVPARIEVSSAHRTPRRTIELIKRFEKEGAMAIIAAAGGAAHLAGVAAAHTLLPVLGVPIPSPLMGVDSLLSMAQMPAGVPVAVFGIGEAGATNSILFVLSLMARDNDGLRKKLARFRREQERSVAEKNKRLQSTLKKK